MSVTRAADSCAAPCEIPPGDPRDTRDVLSEKPLRGSGGKGALAVGRWVAGVSEAGKARGAVASAAGVGSRPEGLGDAGAERWRGKCSNTQGVPQKGTRAFTAGSSAWKRNCSLTKHCLYDYSKCAYTFLGTPCINLDRILFIILLPKCPNLLWVGEE